MKISHLLESTISDLAKTYGPHVKPWAKVLNAGDMLKPNLDLTKISMEQARDLWDKTFTKRSGGSFNVSATVLYLFVNNKTAWAVFPDYHQAATRIGMNDTLTGNVVSFNREGQVVSKRENLRKRMPQLLAKFNGDVYIHDIKPGLTFTPQPYDMPEISGPALTHDWNVRSKVYKRSSDKKDSLAAAKAPAVPFNIPPLSDYDRDRITKKYKVPEKQLDLYWRAFNLIAATTRRDMRIKARRAKKPTIVDAIDAVSNRELYHIFIDLMLRYDPAAPWDLSSFRERITKKIWDAMVRKSKEFFKL